MRKHWRSWKVEKGFLSAPTSLRNVVHGRGLMWVYRQYCGKIPHSPLLSTSAFETPQSPGNYTSSLPRERYCLGDGSLGLELILIFNFPGERKLGRCAVAQFSRMIIGHRVKNMQMPEIIIYFFVCKICNFLWRVISLALAICNNYIFKNSRENSK